MFMLIVALWFLASPFVGLGVGAFIRAGQGPRRESEEQIQLPKLNDAPNAR